MATGKNSYIRNSDRQLILAEPECFYCGLNQGNFHVDHIVPPQLGGSSRTINLVKSCARCNCSKSDRSLDNWLNHLVKKRDEVINKVYGYTYRLYKHRQRNTQIEFQKILELNIILSRREHSRYCRIIGVLKKLING